jgi:predicted nucleic acid-binding protein
VEISSKLKSASKIYLDANVIIYFFERSDHLQKNIGTLIAFAKGNNAELFVSDIGVAECLYGAFNAGSEALAEKYNEAFYEIALFNLIPVTSARIISAAKLGAEKNLKLVDATHFHAAIETGCQIFITNDQRFHTSHGVNVIQLGDFQVLE